MAGGQLPHLTPRQPRGRVFSWGRTIEPDGHLAYRLFLRDSTGKLFMQRLDVPTHAPRRYVAMALRGHRVQLRWVVDQVEFTRLGLKDTTPEPAASFTAQ